MSPLTQLLQEARTGTPTIIQSLDEVPLGIARWRKAIYIHAGRTTAPDDHVIVAHKSCTTPRNNVIFTAVEGVLVTPTPIEAEDGLLHTYSPDVTAGKDLINAAELRQYGDGLDELVLSSVDDSTTVSRINVLPEPLSLSRYLVRQINMIGDDQRYFSIDVPSTAEDNVDGFVTKGAIWMRKLAAKPDDINAPAVHTEFDVFALSEGQDPVHLFRGVQQEEGRDIVIDLLNEETVESTDVDMLYEASLTFATNAIFHYHGFDACTAVTWFSAVLFTFTAVGGVFSCCMGAFIRSKLRTIKQRTEERTNKTK